MTPPLASGVLSVIVPAAKLELRPPPLDCVGGCSKVVPRIVTVEPAPEGQPVPTLMQVALTSVEVNARTSAVPTAGKVVMSTTRKRSRVICAPLLFLKARRIESVPKVVAPLPGVASRTRGQVPPVGLLLAPEVVPVQPVSMSATLMKALR